MKKLAEDNHWVVPWKGKEDGGKKGFLGEYKIETG